MKLKINWEKVLVALVVGVLVALAIRWVLRKFGKIDTDIARVRAEVDTKVNQLRASCGTAFKAVCEENKATISAISAAVETRMLVDPDRLPKGKSGFAQRDPLPTPIAL